MTAQDLKNAILQLAVQGKLVPQDPNDEPASELLKRIKVEKERLIKEGKTKKEKPLAPIADDEIPFDIPESWMWCYIGDLFQHNTGKALNGSDKSGVPMTYITTSNLYWDRFELDNLKEMPFTDSEVEKCTVQKGDLLVCEGGDYGRSAIWPYDYPMRIQNHIHRIRPFGSVCIRYFYYLFYLYKNTEMIAGKGIAIQGLSATALHVLKVPLPPFAEQQRIVAKIEELIPLVEEYGEAEERLTALNAEFPDKLRKSILQQAIQGKLTERDPADEPASELLKRIRAEKERLIKEGKIKKEKPLPPITEEEMPFELPENWEWVRWGDLSRSIQYGYNAPAKAEGVVRMVRISDIQDNHVLWDTVPFCDIPEEEIHNYLLAENDILFARTGGTVGKSFLVKDVPYDAIYAGYLIRTQYSKMLVPEYMKYFMESQLYWNQLRSGTIATAQPNCNGKTLSKMIIPLPPLGEQQRIVDRVNELLAVCDELK